MDVAPSVPPLSGQQTTKGHLDKDDAPEQQAEGAMQTNPGTV